MKLLQAILDKIDDKLTGKLFSRPKRQVVIIVEKMQRKLRNNKVSVVDLGGGHNPQYKLVLQTIAKKYINIEITRGPGVDIVGSVYDIPLKKSSADVITLFMVMEHLYDPLRALKECNRVLNKGGLLAITTVQYWHTHNHPSDYYRYTKAGLEHLCKEAGFQIVSMWSMGGPFLVIFHAIELNLPGMLRTIYSILFYRLANWLDWIVFRHLDTRIYSDSVGWACIAKKI